MPSRSVAVLLLLLPVSVWPLSPAVKWERAVDLADAALYEAKRGGRDRWAAA